MAYDSGALDATLAAAAGDDAALLRELRMALGESLDHHLDLLRRSRCDGNWNMAALRLKGLASSFHVGELVAIADEALELAPGDPTVIRRLQRFIDEFPRG